MARLTRLCVLALTALLLAAPAMAANDAAAVLRGPGGISFQPQVAAAGATLTVTGPGEFLAQYEFESASEASFEITSDMVDGLYTYELVLHPAVGPVTRRAMDRARANGDDFAADALAAQVKIPTLSGFFSIENGTLVSDALVEEAGAGLDATAGDFGVATGAATLTNVNAATQVFTMDVIVQGSECVGVDCTSTESFGADTIRLKENNLRIHFQDTSSSGSFPSADWRIIANDSANGGANYLSIEDSDNGTTPFRILKGAGNNAVYVNASGNVGLGTASPAVELQVTDGDSPALRLEQDGSSGFSPHIWDVAGNETNFFVRDVTNSSKIPFKILPNAPTNSLVVEGSTGDIGIGILNPADAAVHVNRSGTANDVLLKLQNNNTLNLELDDTAETDIWRIRRSGSGLAIDNIDRTTSTVATNNLFFDDGRVRLGAGGNGSESFLLQTNGALAIAGEMTATAYNTSSDRNLKENVEAVDQHDILQKVVALPMNSWSFINDGGKVKHVGPMAQDFYAAFG
ncbi:MAG: tail fiber domain-containing protein, partial [Acidobacteria bacterium]|nr:tail fiber domain-containing protein [Acidobacteriota bacterium]